MPLYEYRCPSCNTKFELLRPMSRAEQEAVCPCCQTPSKRLVSRFASFSKSADGSTAPTGSSCSACSATSCATCH